MKIVEKYLLTEIFKKILITTLSILIIFSIFRIIDESSQTPDGNYTFGYAVLYTLFNLPDIISQIFVISCYIGTIFAVINLNDRRELIAMQVGAVKKSVLSKKITKYGFIASLIFLLSTELIKHPLSEYSEEFKATQKGEISTIIGERNIALKFDNHFIFIDRNLDGKNLQGIYLIQLDKNKQKMIIESQEGEINGERLTLINPLITVIKSIGSSYNITKKYEKSHILDLPFKNTSAFFNQSPSKSDLLYLVKKIVMLRQNSLNSYSYEFELYSRLAKPINVIILLLLSVPFLLKFSRSQSLQKKLSQSILVSIIYLFSIKAISTVSMVNSINPLFLVFGPQLVIISLWYIATRKIKYD